MVSFLLPAGPKNLETLFPLVDFSQLDEYNLQVISQIDDAIILTTPNYRRACCCNEDTFRLFFVNYLGAIDAINFRLKTEETETSSANWKKPNTYPLAKWDGGLQRFNVNSNETIIAENICYQEDDQEWLKELIAAPNAWVQWKGTQGQTDDYIPIVIKDGKFLTRKYEERYYYTMEIQFVYANENSIVRN